MPFMFERATRELVKEIGDKELKPVKYLLSATKIRRFTLVRRKKSRSLFWELPDIPLDVSLMHILEPRTSVSDAAVKAPVLFSDTVVKKQHVGGGVAAGAQVSFLGEATQCQGSSFECQIVTTPHETWKELQKRKLMDPEPSFLGQCRRAVTNLYVVTETVELLKDTELKGLSSQNILGKFSIPLNIFAKGEGQGSGHKVSEKKLTVPQGSVLAYKRKQLVFKGKDWDILHIAMDDKQQTFQEVEDLEPVLFSAWKDLMPVPCSEDRGPLRKKRRKQLVPVPRSVKDLVPVPCSEDRGLVREQNMRTQEVFCEDFKLLLQEVFMTIKGAQLSKDAQDTVFSNIRAMLGDRGALQDLMDMELILYLLEAIIVLNDTQHYLLAYSMEKEILSKQRDLVQSILEPNFLCSGTVPFTLNHELLAPLQGECLSITYGLLAECGLKMELNSPMSTWELEAKEPLCALYATLCILQQLAEGAQAGESLQ